MPRKKSHAIERTISLFSGKTRQEEVEDMVREEETETRSSEARDIVAEAERGNVRWLGLDAFHEGDDIRIAISKSGAAIVMLVDTTRAGVAYATRSFRLSRKQVQKLKDIVSAL